MHGMTTMGGIDARGAGSTGSWALGMTHGTVAMGMMLTTAMPSILDMVVVRDERHPDTGDLYTCRD
jgi:hypothetical protein